MSAAVLSVLVVVGVDVRAGLASFVVMSVVCSVLFWWQLQSDAFTSSEAGGGTVEPASQSSEAEVASPISRHQPDLRQPIAWLAQAPTGLLVGLGLVGFAGAVFSVVDSVAAGDPEVLLGAVANLVLVALVVQAWRRRRTGSS